MPRNGSGTYSRAAGPYVYNTVINQDDVNAEFNDIATALTNSIAKDGQTVPTANLPMGGYKLTGLGAGAADGNSLRYEQLFSTSAVTLLGAMNWVKGADIASASTINLTTATGNGVHVTGTTGISAVTLGSGMWRLVIFDGALTLTHHATNNNLPGGANITTAAGDRALYWADGTTVYCAAYQKATGKATVNPAVGDITGLGANVATALAVAVGTDGAFVVKGGALGTPSSGNVSNCTGVAIVQVAEATPVTAVVACSTVIPRDNTIPQNTEGDEVITVSITPTSATNRLVIDFLAPVVGNSSGAGACGIAALFQDTTANALNMAMTSLPSQVPESHLALTHTMLAGTTSATTFKIRCGLHFGSSLQINADNTGTRVGGGVAAATLRVTEIKP